MRLLPEVVVSIVPHPTAMVLAWINSAGRSDLTGGMRIIWGIGPTLSVLPGGGRSGKRGGGGGGRPRPLRWGPSPAPPIVTSAPAPDSPRTCAPTGTLPATVRRLVGVSWVAREALSMAHRRVRTAQEWARLI